MSKQPLSKFQIKSRKFLANLIPIAKYRRKARRKWLHIPKENSASLPEPLEGQNQDPPENHLASLEAVIHLYHQTGNTAFSGIKEQWSEQIRAIEKCAAHDPMKVNKGLSALLLAKQTKNNILFIDINYKQGGAYAYRKKWIKNQKIKEKNIIVIEFDPGPLPEWKLYADYLPESDALTIGSLDSLEFLFSELNLSEIFINNLAFCEETESILIRLIQWKEKYPMFLHYVFHDFYSVCPSLFLLNEQTSFCNGGINYPCSQCSEKNPLINAKRKDAGIWRFLWKSFLKVCDQCTCFSESTKSIVCQFYPIENKLKIIEHDLLAPFDTKYTYPKTDHPNFAFVGPLHKEKGGQFILDAAKILRSKISSSKIIIFGENHIKADAENIIIYGKYERSKLPELLTAYKINAVLFASPWPETFSYVTQECMEIGVPFVCFDLGAPSERIRKYNYTKGRIASKISAESLLETALSLVEEQNAVIYPPLNKSCS